MKLQILNIRPIIYMYKGTCRIGYDKVNMPEYQIFMYVMMY